MDKLCITPLRLEDLEAVAWIEATSPSPWNLMQVKAEFQNTDSIQLAAYLAGKLVGWCCGRVATGEAELLKIAVGPLYRQKGIASRLLARLERRLACLGAAAVFLEVRSQNTAALNLYLQTGYLRVGCRKKYYFMPEDDAVILRKNLLYPETWENKL